MAIKQRKQITGTTEQINAYAGVEGLLVWDKTKKKWVGMSGTAGTNYPMASENHTHSIANINELQSALDGKQAKGNYATTEALTDGLAGKANSSHTHAVADVDGLQTTLNTIDSKIPKTGNRGAIAGYATSTSGATVDASAKDSQYTGSAVTVKNGTTGQTWTKVVKMSAGTVTVESNWSWVDGEAPELVFPCVLICHWNQDKGIVGIIKGAS